MKKLFPLHPRKWLFFLLIIFLLQTSPAFAFPACSPKEIQTTMEEIKTLNRQLLASPLENIGGGIAPEAKLPMGLLNEALNQWMTSELNCQPGNNFDPIKFDAHIQEAIKPIIAEPHKGKETDGHYGLNGVRLEFYRDQRLLLVYTSQGIPCTENVALAGYRIDDRRGHGGAWDKVINIATDYSAEWPESFRFKKPVFMKDPVNGHTDILLTSIPGQCNSYWYGFTFMVIDPANRRSQRNLFTTEEMYYNGELSDDGGPELKTQGNHFELSWYSPHFEDLDPKKPKPPDTVIKSYKLNNGVVSADKSLK
jgi:hypothetical protein